MIARSSWDSLRALFEAALERPPGERAAFLRERIDDSAIRAEVESLLAAHERAGGFLKDPAIRSRLATDASLLELPRFQPGTRLAAFEILERLGMGGMGEVYRARDTRLDRFVAIKVLSPELDLAARGRERFEREARAISRLSHPHICTVHDLGTAQVDGREVPFLVLELLDGETLASRLARGPLAIDEALRDAIDIADALAAAHAQGIVHRDLKPSNVMVTRSGVKLLDFGLAQLRTPQDPNDGTGPAPRDTSLTRTGMVIGTLPYMSPEQIEGRKADARSDVFSFGSLLYEMLTGRQAFAADPNRSAAAQILSHDPIPMTQLVPAVPAGVEKIVAHCLRKDPGRRYQAIADVKVALEDVREESRGATLQRTSRAGSRRRLALELLAVPTALIAAYFAWIPRGSPDNVPPPRVVPITTLPGSEATPTLAPDGDHIAFTWSGTNQDNFDIYVQRIGSGTEQRRTVHPAAGFQPGLVARRAVDRVSPRWSPRPEQGHAGPAARRGELSLGEIHIRQPYTVPPYLAWFPDGKALVVVNSPAPDKPDALFVISIDTLEREALSSPASDTFDMAPAVSPDGRTVAFTRGHGELYVLGIGDDRRAATPQRRLAESGWLIPRLDTRRKGDRLRVGRGSLEDPGVRWTAAGPSPGGGAGRVLAGAVPIRIHQIEPVGLRSSQLRPEYLASRSAGNRRTHILCPGAGDRVDLDRFEPPVLSGRQASRVSVDALGLEGDLDRGSGRRESCAAHVNGGLRVTAMVAGRTVDRLR